ncbi:hypothetical protein D1222_01980 [Henriciella algicola]|uniref:Uncharacterized protein n=1 Tax=Henriciella algicola TaxID=1608422 RepID=A0A399RHE2_9PROT|nr:hypothetical protein D1222_01980 [Henriciella algicola]
MVTGATRHSTPQDEVLIDVRFRRPIGTALDLLLNLEPGLERDERLVLSWMKIEIPLFDSDTPAIERTLKQLIGTLPNNDAFSVLGD